MLCSLIGSIEIIYIVPFVHQVSAKLLVKNETNLFFKKIYTISILQKIYTKYYFCSTLLYYAVVFGDGSGTLLSFYSANESTTISKSHVETGNI